MVSSKCLPEKVADSIFHAPPELHEMKMSNFRPLVDKVKTVWQWFTYKLFNGIPFFCIALDGRVRHEDMPRLTLSGLSLVRSLRGFEPNGDVATIKLRRA